jgi:hypothetical protein
MPRYRHILRTANGQLRGQFPQGKAIRKLIRIQDLLLVAALHQENCATILNYSERELRYMDAGE